MDPTDPRATVDSHLRYPWRERGGGVGRRCCSWPGCADEGTHRAPRSREHLREFVWFCLEHVREYNRTWDFFAGMSGDEIDAHRRADVTWHRPTWRFGLGGGVEAEAFSGSARFSRHPRFDDPFGFAGTGAEDTPSASVKAGGRCAAMIRTLELDAGFTLEQLRERFKALVKRWHPDLHNGDKDAEARLREVIEAYRYLRDNGLYAG